NCRFGKAIRSLTPEAVRVLEGHDWPGNVRELQNVIKFGLLHATGAVLDAGHLPIYLRRESDLLPFPAPEAPPAAAPDACDLVSLVRGLLRNGERDVYDKVTAALDRAVLERCCGTSTATRCGRAKSWASHGPPFGRSCVYRICTATGRRGQIPVRLSRTCTAQDTGPSSFEGRFPGKSRKSRAGPSKVRQLP